MITRKTLGLDGSERIDVAGIAGRLAPRSALERTITRVHGRRETLRPLLRLDTRREVAYHRHGGLLHGLLHRVFRDRLRRTEAAA